MWILMKVIYTGPLGIFLKGNKYDLPADIVKKLPKNSYEQTCAPWDEHIDKKAAEKNKQLEDAHAAIKKTESITAEIDGLNNSIKAGQQRLAKLQKEQNAAINNAKKLAKTAGIDWPSKA